MTTDPKVCPDARVIRRMSFDEAAELAQFGAKALHPATLAPAMRENIPVYVLNSKRPLGEGTEITAPARTSKAVYAITAKRNVATVEIKAIRGGDSQMLHDVFAVFERHSCPVDVMAMTPGHMLFLLESTSAFRGIAEEFKGVAEVRWENHKALVCLVGEDIRRQPEVASRAFAEIGRAHV